MKKKLTALIAASMLVAALALTGCGETAPAEESSAAPVSSQAESSSVPAASSEAPVSSESSAPADDTAFEEKFAENPIDAAYNQQSAEATTNQEMIALENTYAGLWKSEISHAYQELLANQADDVVQEVEADQKAWNENVEDAIEEIKSGTDDGTNALLERAVLIKNLYRDKAKELYSQLYQNNPDYEYIYTPY